MNTRNTINLIIIIIALLVPYHTFSQQPDFQYYYPFWSENYIGSHTIELTTENGLETECFFVAICDYFRDWYVYEQESIYPAKVLKLSLTGEFLGELTISEEGKRSVIDRLFHDPENTQYILAMGKIRDKEEHYDKPFLAKFDKDLNVVWQREIDLPEPFHKYFYGASVMMDGNGDIVYCTAPYETNPQGPVSWYVHRLYLRLSSEGDVLSLHEFPEESDLVSGGQGNLFEYADDSGDYGQSVIVAPSGSESNTKILRMNHDFEILDTITIDPHLHLSSGSVTLLYFERNITTSYPDGSLVLGCDALYAYFDYNTMTTKTNDMVAMVKINYADSIVNASFAGLANDSLNTLAKS